MNYTDPSGYLFFGPAKSLLRKIAKVPILNTLITIGLNFIPHCTAWCSAVYAGASTYAVTGSLRQGIKVGLVSYVASKAHTKVGDLTDVGSTGNILGNALVGGLSAQLQGGSFKHGFMAAGFAAAFKPMINDIGGENSANAAIKDGNLAKLEIHKVDRIIVAGIIGGTASVLSGGKFANGALTGALTQMYNGEVKNTKDANDMSKLKAALEKADLPIEYVKKYYTLLNEINAMVDIAKASENHAAMLESLSEEQLLMLAKSPIYKLAGEVEGMKRHPEILKYSLHKAYSAQFGIIKQLPHARGAAKALFESKYLPLVTDNIISTTPEWFQQVHKNYTTGQFIQGL